jgi:hypothetical protein
VVWFVATGLALLFTVSRSAQTHFFRQAALNAVRLTLYVEFLLNLYVVSLPLELILEPLLFLILVIPIFARNKPESA